MRHKAIYLLYSKAIRIGDIAGVFDVNGNKIDIDESLVQAKIAELEAVEPLRLLREERDKKLAATDWRATVDYPGNDKQLWLDYRQALRDVTEQDPNNVIWPSEPA